MIGKTVAQWKREHGQGWIALPPQDREHRSAAIISELARYRDASSSSIDEQDGRNRETGSARDSASTHGQLAGREHPRGSLFIESSESEGQLESPQAPVASTYSLSPRMERGDLT